MLINLLLRLSSAQKKKKVRKASIQIQQNAMKTSKMQRLTTSKSKKDKDTGLKKTQLSSAIIAKNLVILQKNARMKRNGIIAYYVEKILMTLLIAMKKCVLSVTRLVIMLKNVRKRISYSARNVTILVMRVTDASKCGLSQMSI